MHAKAIASANAPGLLFRGDNLEVLRRRVADESIDLVYLDPPFFSQRTYEAVVRNKTDRGRARPKLFAFDDSFRWDAGAEAAHSEVVERAGPLGVLLDGLARFLGPSDRLAYLSMMALRLVEIRRVLKPSGSLYLHCDPTASHYLKLLLDAAFGERSFKNEVIWRYRRWPAKSRAFQRMHDVLLYYVKDPSSEHVFNTLYGYESLAESTRKTFGTKKQLADFSSGHRKPGVVDAESRGPPLSDVWEVSVIAPIGKERLGYPTQKPEALLERVIRASSAPGDVVLDPFCGSGSALAVAERLGRRWIGIDRSEVALSLARRRLGVQSA